MKKFIAYYRVSTKQQGNSGLGLDAQKTMVRNFLKEDDILIDQFEEVESGKNDNRPQLLKAIEKSKSEGATLLIAKLDRLSRNAGFIFLLKDSNVDFKCCDMPEANSLTIGIMACLAQEERELISKRTTAALQELKAKGIKLGNPQNLTPEARQLGNEMMRLKALQNENNRKATALIVSLRNAGSSYGKIADALNENGFKTSRGCEFTSSQTLILYDRFLQTQIIT
ncbi:recombinase family protein [Epilithonimonas pallida]|uniref:Site-specific DNA recombinase n=1 Tax=Epilithonimonas pallida TaxID=373671 RepID=A0ABY1R5X8_9FLAO|nr:recombinase family protein [Epilithonimonas pallida]SMP96582.1 Site-specific DNA recombinase [Epilithonimonas pallida]